MGKPLQILLAVTCVAVLAVIGYWAWQQYEAGRQADVVAKYQQRRSICLEDLAKSRASSDPQRLADLDVLVRDCIDSGLLNNGDFN